MSTTSSCEKQEPFIKLENGGQASVLNYNLPQSTTYEAQTSMVLDIDNPYFKPEQRTAPSGVGVFWDEVDGLTLDEIIQKLRNSTLSVSTEIDGFINNQISTYLNSSLVKGLREKYEYYYSNGTASLGDLTAILDVKVNSIKDENYSEFAEKIHLGLKPSFSTDFSGKTIVSFISKPNSAVPQISMNLHLKMSSYLGNYGAGRTVETFSLLPGEKTSVTVRTYQNIETIKEQAQNVLDSFSESSAKELQDTVSREVQNESSYNKANESNEAKSLSVSASGKVRLGFVKIKTSANGTMSKNTKRSSSEALNAKVGLLTSATNQHASKADAVREIEVNTSTTSSVTNETEETITREIENINKSRTLNFVFRQLLQEFITLTYLDDVSFVYSNGYTSENRSCKLSGLEDMLKEVMVSSAVNDVLNSVYTELSSIIDFKNSRKSLIELKNETLQSVIDPTITEDISYVRVKKQLQNWYWPKNGNGINVNGIILDATHRILRTPSLIVEALLGQGEALDCYNQKLQSAATYNAELQNEKLQQAMQVVDGVTDPSEKAQLYKKVFGDCCDVPQSGCGCQENMSS